MHKVGSKFGMTPLPSVQAEGPATEEQALPEGPLGSAWLAVHAAGPRMGRSACRREGMPVVKRAGRWEFGLRSRLDRGEWASLTASMRRLQDEGVRAVGLVGDGWGDRDVAAFVETWNKGEQPLEALKIESSRFEGKRAPMSLPTVTDLDLGRTSIKGPALERLVDGMPDLKRLDLRGLPGVGLRTIVKALTLHTRLSLLQVGGGNSPIEPNRAAFFLAICAGLFHQIEIGGTNGPVFAMARIKLDADDRQPDPPYELALVTGAVSVREAARAAAAVLGSTASTRGLVDGRLLQNGLAACRGEKKKVEGGALHLLGHVFDLDGRPEFQGGTQADFAFMGRLLEKALCDSELVRRVFGRSRLSNPRLEEVPDIFRRAIGVDTSRVQKKGTAHCFYSGWNTHCISVMVRDRWMLIGNRGRGHGGQPGVTAYRTKKDLTAEQANLLDSCDDPKRMQRFLTAEGGEPPELVRDLGGEVFCRFPLFPQVSESCAWASAECALLGLMFLVSLTDTSDAREVATATFEDFGRLIDELRLGVLEDFTHSLEFLRFSDDVTSAAFVGVAESQAASSLQENHGPRFEAAMQRLTRDCDVFWI